MLRNSRTKKGKCGWHEEPLNWRHVAAGATCSLTSIGWAAAATAERKRAEKVKSLTQVRKRAMRRGENSTAVESRLFFFCPLSRIRRRSKVKIHVAIDKNVVQVVRCGCLLVASESPQRPAFVWNRNKVRFPFCSEHKSAVSSRKCSCDPPLCCRSAMTIYTRRSPQPAASFLRDSVDDRTDNQYTNTAVLLSWWLYLSASIRSFFLRLSYSKKHFSSCFGFLFQLFLSVFVSNSSNSDCLATKSNFYFFSLEFSHLEEFFLLHDSPTIVGI